MIMYCDEKSDCDPAPRGARKQLAPVALRSKERFNGSRLRLSVILFGILAQEADGLFTADSY